MKTKDELHAEAGPIIRRYTKRTVAMSMGTGKTYLALKEIDQTPGKVLVAGSTAIQKSWKADAIKFNLAHLLNRITFSTIVSLLKHDPSDYKLVVVDESHTLKKKHEPFVKQCKNYLGLTGTPPRPWGDAGRIISNHAPIVFEYLLDEAIEDGIVNDYNIVVHMIPLSTEANIERKRKDGGKFFTSEANDYRYRTSCVSDSEQLRKEGKISEKQLTLTRIQRMSAIKGYQSKATFVKKMIVGMSERMMIFANTKVQADSLCKNSYYSGNPRNDDNMNLFNTKAISRLSCVEQLSRGINPVDVGTAIILHMYSGGSDKGPQRFGRLLRLKPDETCTLHVICYRGTVDEKWVRDSLSTFNENKITWINH